MTNPASEQAAGRILEHLTAIPPGRVYLLAPKQYFLRGYEYYRKGLVIGFAWSGDRGVPLSKAAGGVSSSAN